MKNIGNLLALWNLWHQISSGEYYHFNLFIGYINRAYYPISSTMLSVNKFKFVRQMSSFVSENSVKFSVNGNARIISLNRPQKLNALSNEMCNSIIPRLVEFSNSNSAKLIIIDSTNEKSFCSGGDIVNCVKDNLSGNSNNSIDFFQNEYNLNYLLSTYGKPIVSIANGIVMGGGVGLSVHNSFRVITDSTRFAMPETSIGFFNDVGTSFWLPKLDFNLGYYLSLTGDELIGIDNLLLGYGTHYVPSSKLNDLKLRLSEIDYPELYQDKRNNSTIFNKNSTDQLFALVNSIIEEFTIEIPKNHKFKFNNNELNTIEKCFNPNTQKSVNDIIKSLEEDSSEFAIKTINKLNEKSPLSLNLNWNLLLKNKNVSIKNALQRELKLAGKLMSNYEKNDFNDFINEKLILKNKEKLISKNYKSIDSVPSSIVENLISLDVFNKSNSENDQSIEDSKSIAIQMEKLNSLRISSPKNLKNSIGDFTNYPHHMGLPTEIEIKNFITGGNDKSVEPVTYNDVIKYFKLKYDNKAGIDAKIKLVLNRKDYGLAKL